MALINLSQSSGVSNKHRKPLICFVEPLSASVQETFKSQIDIFNLPSTDEASILANIGDADALVIRTKGRISRHIIEAAPRLRVIGRYGIGVDHIDMQAAREHNITVVNTPQASVQSVAEFTILLLLSVARKLSTLDKCVRLEEDWRNFSHLTGIELSGRTLGIVGIGHIGKRVAEIASAFGIRIFYYDYKGREWDGASSVKAVSKSLDSLFAESDMISIHVPARPGNHHLISRALLESSRPGLIFINTARGGLVDEDALIEQLLSGRIAGAGLDVMNEEPLRNSRLQSLETVVLSPHAAAFTREAFFKMEAVVEDVIRVLSGDPPLNPVLS